MSTKRPRKDRKDITVGTLEKKHGMPPGTIRNTDGRDTRSDKKLGTIRERGEVKTSRAAKTLKVKFPQCAHCARPVESLTVSPHPTDVNKSIVEYQCHGEMASQEISSSVLASKQGLALYTVFNSFTSGLMPGKLTEAATAKKEKTLVGKRKSPKKGPL